MKRLEVNPSWVPRLEAAGLKEFEDFWRYPAQSFKKKKDREILFFPLGERRLFLKRYHFSFWQGFQERGAGREWWAAQSLSKEGFAVPSPVALGVERGLRRRRAFSLFAEAPGERLEDLLRAHPQDYSRFLSPLVQTVARFHQQGYSHQDLYLCHLFWHEGEVVFIDLQRVRHTAGFKPRWIIKDLAELFYSARQILGPLASEFEREFLELYAAFHPWIRRSQSLIRLEKKIQRIARHDAKLQARKRP